MRNQNHQPGSRYKDSHGAVVTVERVEHNRVTFYRDGYQHTCVQPIERFMKEFREVAP
ncbi:DUF4222 domain-containing protein [Citrobacter portucalensis]|uniref:DUF4222 domain-containing protein n=1 Tax=Citrobacter portucalensis TaxID=1639133 RepID=UPI0018A4F0D5|nr:DUF4222 domain-containing protein [Citrobacter portucalensis]BBV48834.1 hypothetical protein STW0522CIT30_00940 [Citrobacter portucalensis]